MIHRTYLEDTHGTVCVYAYSKTAKTMYTSSLNVDKDYRRQGIGSKLMQRAENHARSNNSTAVMLLTKEHTIAHTIAHAMYTKRGYTYVCEAKDYKSSSLIWLTKIL